MFINFSDLSDNSNSITEMGPTHALKQQPKLKDNLKMLHNIMWNVLTGPLLLMKENTECGLRTAEVHTPWTTCLSGFLHGLKGTAHLNNQLGQRGTHIHTDTDTHRLIELHIPFPKEASVYLFAICLNLPVLMLLCCKWVRKGPFIKSLGSPTGVRLSHRSMVIHSLGWRTIPLVEDRGWGW